MEETLIERERGGEKLGRKRGWMHEDEEGGTRRKDKETERKKR